MTTIDEYGHTLYSADEVASMLYLSRVYVAELFSQLNIKGRHLKRKNARGHVRTICFYSDEEIAYLKAENLTREEKKKAEIKRKEEQSEKRKAVRDAKFSNKKKKPDYWKVSVYNGSFYQVKAVCLSCEDALDIAESLLTLDILAKASLHYDRRIKK